MSRQIDLIPEAYAVGYLVRQRAVRWAVVAAVTVVIVIGVSLGIRRHAANLNKEMAGLRQKVAMMAGWPQNLRDLVGELSGTLERQETVKLLLGEPYWCGVLCDIGAATGGVLWLTDLSVRRELITSDEAGGRGDDDIVSETVAHVAISGVAPSNVEVIRFLRALEESEFLFDLELQESTMPGALGGEVSVEFRVRGKAV